MKRVLFWLRCIIQSSIQNYTTKKISRDMLSDWLMRYLRQVECVCVFH